MNNTIQKYLVHRTKQNNFIILKVNVEPYINYNNGSIEGFIIKSHNLPYDSIRRLPYSVKLDRAYDNIFDAENYINSIYPQIKDEELKSFQDEIDSLNKRIEKLQNKKVSIRRFDITK